MYYMSNFKVSMCILAKLESLRRNFFLGVDKNEKKMAWVSQEKVLSSKYIVEALVLTIFLLLIGLFKQTLPDALWVRVVKSIHGSHGFLDHEPPRNKNSTWLDIIYVDIFFTKRCEFNV